MNIKAYEKESLDYTVRELMPDAYTFRLIGVEDEDRVALRATDKDFHPTFIKAVQHKYEGLTSESVYMDVTQGYVDAWLNKTGRTVTHHQVWSNVFNLTTSKAIKLDKSIFPHENLKSFEGIGVGTLYFASQRGNSDVASSMSYRNINKLLGDMYSERNLREAASQNYLQAFIDYGKEASTISKEAIRNLVAFYNEVNTRSSSVAFKTWIDKQSWEFYKDYIFEQANTLNNANFTKFIDADLPIKYWEEHVDMPREWLINLYKN